MRPAIYVAAVLGLLALAPEFSRAVLAGAAAIVLESLPYLLATALLVPVAGRYARAAMAYAGCGCGGPGAARSIPAALATGMLFGWPVALARLAAGTFAGLRSQGEGHEPPAFGELLSELLGPALAAGAAAAAAPLVGLDRLAGPWAFAVGAAAGAAFSPCALGAVALAAALRAHTPMAAWGMLCTAGIVTVGARGHRQARPGDPWAFVLLAAACASVAVRAGAQLVHPHIAVALAIAAPVCAGFAIRARRERNVPIRVACAAVLLAVIVGAPAPAYRATETTLGDGFAGERMTFTGVAVRDRGVSALVRYAITCCRADAAPVALAIDRDLTNERGRWLRADGILTATPRGLRLHASRIEEIAPPADPFVYR